LSADRPISTNVVSLTTFYLLNQLTFGLRPLHVYIVWVMNDHSSQEIDSQGHR